MKSCREAGKVTAYRPVSRGGLQTEGNKVSWQFQLFQYLYRTSFNILYYEPTNAQLIDKLIITIYSTYPRYNIHTSTNKIHIYYALYIQHQHTDCIYSINILYIQHQHTDYIYSINIRAVYTASTYRLYIQHQPRDYI
jgi:hypothetical protein